MRAKIEVRNHKNVCRKNQPEWQQRSYIDRKVILLAGKIQTKDFRMNGKKLKIAMRHDAKFVASSIKQKYGLNKERENLNNLSE